MRCVFVMRIRNNNKIFSSLPPLFSGRQYKRIENGSLIDNKMWNEMPV